MIQLRMQNRLLYLFLGLHALFWTVGSYISRASLTHDTLEGIAWGNQLQLGYSKHPPLAAWYSALAYKLGGEIGVYFASQILIVLTFIAVFKLAQKIFDNKTSIISVLLLEGILYHNINSINLTPDTIQTPIWACLTLVFYNSIKSQKISTWFLTGVFAGLAILAKYSAALLFLPMLIISILEIKNNNNSYKKAGIYIAILTSLFIAGPHIYWVIKQNFTTINYLQSSMNNFSNKNTFIFFDHIKYPIKFILGQTGIILGLILMAIPIILKSKRKKFIPPEKDKYKIFFVIMGTGPFLLTILYAIISGKHVIPRWTTPYYYLSGILLLMWLKPNFTEKLFKQQFTHITALSILILLFRCSYFYWSPILIGNTNSDAFLPNKQIALHIEKVWHTHCEAPLKFIAGSHYLTTFISVYNKEHPIPYMGLDQNSSPWIDKSKLEKSGMIIAWEVNEPVGRDAAYKTYKQYPNAKFMGTIKFNKNIAIRSRPVEIAIAIVYPKNT